MKKIIVYGMAIIVSVLWCSISAFAEEKKKPFKDNLLLTEKAYKLQLVTSELKNPIGMKVAPGDKTRMYVHTQPGRIAILKNGKITGTFLDLRNGSDGNHIVSNFAKTGFAPFDERGLLGLAFHPDFASNGKFYVHYSHDNTEKLKTHTGIVANHITRISEFTINNRDSAKKGSEKVILEFPQPMWNHNGGAILFGPDGYLYIATGDGGGADDNDEGHTGGKGAPFSKDRPTGVLGNSQDATNLLGNILRIDVNNTTSGQNYSIPKDNPFVGSGKYRKEIYHMGLRNPWRVSFDKKGQIHIADVGQNKYEMIWKPKKPSNMGWRMFEAGQVFDQESISKYMSSSPLPLLLEPTTIYAHPGVSGGIPQIGISITGGFVYDGQLSELKGNYVFADWSSTFFDKGTGKILMLKKDGSIVKIKFTEKDGFFRKKVLESVDGYIQGIDQDSEGELYFFIAPVSQGERKVFDPFKGKMYKLVLE